MLVAVFSVAVVSRCELLELHSVAQLLEQDPRSSRDGVSKLCVSKKSDAVCASPLTPRKHTRVRPHASPASLSASPA
jgi:hypothetical protein